MDEKELCANLYTSNIKMINYKLLSSVLKNVFLLISVVLFFSLPLATNYLENNDSFMQVFRKYGNISIFRFFYLLTKENMQEVQISISNISVSLSFLFLLIICLTYFIFKNITRLINNEKKLMFFNEKLFNIQTIHYQINPPYTVKGRFISSIKLTIKTILALYFSLSIVKFYVSLL